MVKLPTIPGMFLACAGLALLLQWGGCVSARGGKGVALKADDFSSPDQARGAAAAPEPARQPLRELSRATPEEASEGIVDVVAKAGEPALPEREPAPAGDSVLVDGTAGYVNNKAIYINDFFAPMEARLRADAKQYTREQWINGIRQGDQVILDGARKRIRDHLEGLIEDELLGAEAMASFRTEEERHGLMAYFQQVRSDIKRQYGGTEAGANEALAQRDQDSLADFGDVSGKNLDEVVEQIRRREIIRYQLRQRIASRSYVPWRDVAYGYEREYDYFNPPPEAVFRLVSVPAGNTKDVQGVTDALAAGKDLAEIASSPLNAYLPERGGLWSPKLTGKFETSAVFQNKVLDEAAHKLRVGEMAGPIKAGQSVFWMRFEELRSESMGLYEAQLDLEAKLRNRRFNEERARYIDRLKARASYTNIDEMTDRLLAIAIERYYPAGAGARGGR